MELRKVFTSFRTIFLLTLAFQASYGQDGNIPDKPKNNLTLTVDLSKVDQPLDKLFLSYYNTTTKFRFTDSITLGASKIGVFKTFVNEPILAQLRVTNIIKDTAIRERPKYARDYFAIYLESGKISVVAKDSLGVATVKGSAAHNDYVSLKSEVKKFDPQFDSLYKQYDRADEAKDSLAQVVIEKRIDSLQSIVNEKVYKAFVESKGKQSPVALYALSQYIGYSIDPQKAQPVFDLLGPSIKNLPAGKSFQQRIDVARHLEVGKYALPFTQNDTLGNPISLASLKGKYVLIDFWASWCGPCRAENPNVVKAFEKYKDKDFTVLGVSLDRPGQKDKWLKAIHDDQLAWTQVSDLNFWENEVAKLYDINAIPQNFLLDKDGKIIAKNVRGEDLENALGNLIKSEK